MGKSYKPFPALQGFVYHTAKRTYSLPTYNYLEEPYDRVNGALINALLKGNFAATQSFQLNCRVVELVALGQNILKVAQNDIRISAFCDGCMQGYE